MEARGRRDFNSDEIDDDVQGEILKGDQEGDMREADLERLKRAAAARLDGRRRLDNVIDLIVLIKNIQVPRLPPPRM